MGQRVPCLNVVICMECGAAIVPLRIAVVGIKNRRHDIYDVAHSNVPSHSYGRIFEFEEGGEAECNLPHSCQPEVHIV